MDDLNHVDDERLLTDGNRPEEAFAVFYRRHVQTLLRLCARRGLNAAEAADVTAETFAAALLARRRYRADLGSPRAWLQGIAANKIADHARRLAREQRAQRRLGMQPYELSEHDIADFEALLDHHEEPALAALEELPAGQSGGGLRARGRAGGLREDRPSIADQRSRRTSACQSRTRQITRATTKGALMRDFISQLEDQLIVAARVETRRRPVTRFARSLVALPPRGAATIAGAAATVVLGILVGFPTSSAPAPALAYPVLAKPPTDASEVVKRVPPDARQILMAAGAVSRQARAISTPWGTGYAMPAKEWQDALSCRTRPV